jgi:hypothetical protein
MLETTSNGPSMTVDFMMIAFRTELPPITQWSPIAVAGPIRDPASMRTPLPMTTGPSIDAPAATELPRPSAT